MRRHRSRRSGEFFWPAIVMKKWLNITPKGDEFSADEKDTESEFDEEDASSEKDSSGNDFSPYPISSLKATATPSTRFLQRLRRGKSETMRVQYIDTKELKILVGTWNVGGLLPPDNFDISEWLEEEQEADIYVLGFQEVVPLNAGNIFGAEDSSPIVKWEAIIRRTLNANKSKSKCKCYSAPASPSRAATSDDTSTIADVLLSPEKEVLSNSDMEVPPENSQVEANGDRLKSSNVYEGRSVSSRLGRTDLTWSEESFNQECQRSQSLAQLKRFYSSSGRIGGNGIDSFIDPDSQYVTSNPKFKRMYSLQIGLSWPEQPLDSETPELLPTVDSCEKTDAAEKSPSCLELLDDVSLPDLPSAKANRFREKYVRIVSKQMIGIYVSIWALRTLRRHINNIKVSPVGVGVMGYIGNKGSISVSMSIYQTSFCFVCTHLTSGEREGDALKRNSDVLEILRRTRFPSISGIEMPQTILEHDRAIWFGDLNYRLNLSHEKTHELISKEEWEELSYSDQLKKQLRKGCVFDGWSEGVIVFAPTYKYELNSSKYSGENVKAGEKKRTPAWCDRILYTGKGIRQMSYKRVENQLSDHRPVNSIFLAEVEVFSRKKLQRALTFTDKELEVEQLES
eukprot:TRINITY_DN825_c0_g1_i3.p1 TRINITY_DN825_c0_g1~~TRINITY_DN825_c0_g1_i3.p1  ORF type:complete len:625 (+),score=121.54 TRINITY_DN825_c0_g1_i3:340-2214(+)